MTAPAASAIRSLLVFLGLGLLLAGVTRLEVNTDPFATLAPDPVEEEARRQFQATFGTDRILTVLLHQPQGVFAPGPMKALVDLAHALEDQPWAGTVESLGTTPAIRPGLAGAVEASALFPPLPADAAGWEKAKKDALDNLLFRGLLLSADAKTTAIYVTLADWTLEGRILSSLESVLNGPEGASPSLALLRESLQQARLDAIRARASDPSAPLPEVAAVAFLQKMAAADPKLGSLLTRAQITARADILNQATTATAFLEEQLQEPSLAQAFPTRHILGAHLIARATADAYPPAFQRTFAFLLGAAALLVMLASGGRLSALREGVLVLFCGGAALGSYGWLGIPLDPVVTGGALLALLLASVTAGARHLGMSLKTVRSASLAGSLSVLAGAAFMLSQPAPGLRNQGLALGVAALLPLLVGLVWPGNPLPSSPSNWTRPPRILALALGSGMVLVGLLAARVHAPIPGLTWGLPEEDPVRLAYAEAEALLPGSLALSIHIQPVDPKMDQPLLTPAFLTYLHKATSSISTFPGVGGVMGPDAVVAQMHQAATGFPGLPEAPEALGQEIMLFGSPRALRPVVDEGWRQARLLIRIAEGFPGGSLGFIADQNPKLQAVLGPAFRVEGQGDLLRHARAVSANQQALTRSAQFAAGVSVLLLLGLAWFSPGKRGAWVAPGPALTLLLTWGRFNGAEGVIDGLPALSLLAAVGAMTAICALVIRDGTTGSWPWAASLPMMAALVVASSADAFPPLEEWGTAVVDGMLAVAVLGMGQAAQKGKKSGGGSEPPRRRPQGTTVG